MLFIYMSIIILFVIKYAMHWIQLWLLHDAKKNSFFLKLLEKEIGILTKIRDFFDLKNIIIYNYIVFIVLIFITMLLIRCIFYTHLKKNKNFYIKNLVLISMFVAFITTSSQAKSLLPLTFFVYVMLSNFLPLYEGLLVVIANDTVSWLMYGFSHFSFIWLYMQILLYIFIYSILSYKINYFNIILTGIVFAITKTILNVVNVAMFFKSWSIETAVFYAPIKFIDDIFAIIVICFFMQQIKAFIKRFAQIRNK